MTSERGNRDHLETLLKRFRRELNESGQLRDHRRKRFFVSKGEAMREKRRKADRRRRRREVRLQTRDTHRNRKR
ncbi:MAG: 30S ribosomal protein S21 [Chloroflexia bacterium]|nr:30S ribosomal protein S21 [Chloroflexia bacterium]